MDDLLTRGDVEQLVDAFYLRVRDDEVLGPIFDDVARVDWAAHLPKMYDFWQTVLFGAAAYRGDPMGAHVGLARMTPLGPREFTRWLALFDATVDALFEGPGAESAKARAARIAAVMQHHIPMALTTPPRPAEDDDAGGARG
ncbi:MAG: group III truncated hemoglobin [Acidobacteria bacterium]|nr:group III truncated hemoglobin [Acidobacteriota bacterium]